MKMKNKFIPTLLSALTLAGVASSLAACGPNKPIDSADVEDPNKTQLNVYSYNGGYRAEWLDKTAAAFEEAVKDKSYESGKTGVQIHIHRDKANKAVTDVTQLDSSKDEVFFTEHVDYDGYTQAQSGNRFLDLTDVVTETSPYDSKTIESKMNDAQKSFLQQNGRYYAIPHYSGFYGLIYNVEMFQKNNFYIDVDGNLCAVTNKEKGNGPDGIKGTDDDGLPATFDQFFYLCTYIRAQNIYSVHWTGQYYTMHLSELYRALAANIDGVDNTMLSSTYDGTVTNAVKLNAAGEPAEITYEEGRPVHASSITTESVKVEDKKGSREGAYRTLGNYYGGEFIQRLLHSEYGGNNYFSTKAFTDTYSHLNAQSDFVRSDTAYATKENNNAMNYAMLVDGPWWESEARETFDQMEKSDPNLAKEKRNFAWMPLPFPTQDMVGTTPTLYDNISAFAFAKASLSGGKAAAAKDLLRFAYSDNQLVEFTKDTGVKRNLKYDIPEDAYKSMTPYGKSLARYMDGANVVFPYVNTTYFQSNFQTLTGSTQYYQASFSGKTYNAPAAFRSIGDLSAAKWFSAFYQAKKGN